MAVWGLYIVLLGSQKPDAVSDVLMLAAPAVALAVFILAAAYIRRIDEGGRAMQLFGGSLIVLVAVFWSVLEVVL